MQQPARVGVSPRSAPRPLAGRSPWPASTCRVPGSPTTGVLYGVVRSHWKGFAATVRERTDGVGLATFIVSEFRKFLRCGVLAHGFARIRCGDCAFERLLPFSCKGGPLSELRRSVAISVARPWGSTA